MKILSNEGRPLLTRAAKQEMSPRQAAYNMQSETVEEVLLGVKTEISSEQSLPYVTPLLAQYCCCPSSSQTTSQSKEVT